MQYEHMANVRNKPATVDEGRSTVEGARTLTPRLYPQPTSTRREAQAMRAVPEKPAGEQVLPSARS